MKRIAVIGANGYIARNLIYILKRNYPDYDTMLYGVEDKCIDNHANYIQVDMTDRNDVQKIDLNCDIIFMLVGRTGTINGFEQFDSFIDVNEKSLLNLLNEYRRQKSKARIVFPSTRLVYKGKNGFQKEDSEKEFKTIYAMNKYACEQYLIQFHSIYNVEYSIFRICVPYGTFIEGASSYGTAEFMISKAQKGENITLYGDGSVRRTITHIEDLCVSLIDGANSTQCANDVFNIGGENYSLKEMAELIAKKYAVGIDYIPWPDLAQRIESGDTVFDSEKITNAIGNRIIHQFIDWVEN